MIKSTCWLTHGRVTLRVNEQMTYIVLFATDRTYIVLFATWMEKKHRSPSPTKNNDIVGMVFASHNHLWSAFGDGERSQSALVRLSFMNGLTESNMYNRKVRAVPTDFLILHPSLPMTKPSGDAIPTGHGGSSALLPSDIVEIWWTTPRCETPCNPGEIYQVVACQMMLFY